jgi:hypothetical protein
MKNIGLLLLLAGCLMMLFQGINFMATEKVIDLGNIEITHTKRSSFRMVTGYRFGDDLYGWGALYIWL